MRPHPLVTLLVLAAASPALAQEAGDPRALFESGSAALEAHDFERAVADLERSLELAPRPGTAANLAVALRELGRPAESVAVFDRLLAGELGELSDEMRTAIEAERQLTAPQRAILTLRSTTDVDADVRIGDAEPLALPAGQSVEHALDPGNHAVAASAPGHEPLELEVQLDEGERQTVVVALREHAPLARLEVVAADPTLEVQIVGVGSARGALSERLDPGEYVVRVIGPDGSDERRVRLSAGERRRLTLDAPSGDDLAESPWLWLTVGLVVLGGAAAGIGLAVAFPQREVLPPPDDPTFGQIFALRLGD